MPLHWIFYRGKDSPDGVVIIDGETLVDARMSARRRGLENGVFFAEGHILNPELAAIVEPQEIGRFLSLSEANWIIRQFEVVNSDPKPARERPILYLPSINNRPEGLKVALCRGSLNGHLADTSSATPTSAKCCGSRST